MQKLQGCKYYFGFLETEETRCCRTPLTSPHLLNEELLFFLVSIYFKFDRLVFNKKKKKKTNVMARSFCRHR